MDFAFTPEQERIREAIVKLCERFDADYWLARDRDGVFPAEFQQACARDGWLGIAMPEQYGGAGRRLRAPAGMMPAIAETRAGFSGCSSGHMTIFRPNPSAVLRTEGRERRALPTLDPSPARA